MFFSLGSEKHPTFLSRVNTAERVVLAEYRREGEYKLDQFLGAKTPSKVL
jgi:hypothetical protein